MDQEDVLDCSQPSASYVEFLHLNDRIESPPPHLPQLFGATRADTFSLWPHPDLAWRAVIDAHLENSSRKSIGYMGPIVPEMEGLREEGFEIINLGIDPEEYLLRDPKEISLLILFSPHPTDASFFTPELLARTSKHFMQNAELRVVIDESLSSLFWDARDEIGLLRYVDESRVSIFFSMQAWTRDQKPLTLILRGPENLKSSMNFPESESWPLLLSLWLREFHRGAQHLRLRSAISRSGRTLLEKLRHAIDADKIRCPHWPRAGHSLFLVFPHTKALRLADDLEKVGIRAPVLLTKSEDAALRITLPVSLKLSQELGERLLKLPALR